MLNAPFGINGLNACILPAGKCLGISSIEALHHNNDVTKHHNNDVTKHHNNDVTKQAIACDITSQSAVMLSQLKRYITIMML